MTIRPGTAATGTAVAAAGTAAVVHGYMFVKESVQFTHPRTLRMLEVPDEHAGAVRLWAYHQGVYNLLLGATAAAGGALLLTGSRVPGGTLLAAAATSMTVAAAALLAADPRPERIPGFLAQAAPALTALTAIVASRPLRRRCVREEGEGAALCLAEPPGGQAGGQSGRAGSRVKRRDRSIVL
jgi:putative membrane protein